MNSWLSNKHIVVPVNFSPECHKALTAALEMAADDTSRVHIAHVLPELSPLEPGVRFGEMSEDTRREKVRKTIREKLNGLSVPENVQIAVLLGSVPKQVVRYADEIGAGLIVLPAHKKHESFSILGSQTERIVHLAKCPVLVLKGDC